MTRINAIRNAAHSVSWGKAIRDQNHRNRSLGQPQRLHLRSRSNCLLRRRGMLERETEACQFEPADTGDATRNSRADTRACYSSRFEAGAEEARRSQATRDGKLRRQELRRDF